MNFIIFICPKCYAPYNAYDTLFLLPGLSLAASLIHAVLPTAELTTSHFLQIYLLYNCSQETGFLKCYTLSFFIKHSFCLWMLQVIPLKDKVGIHGCLCFGLVWWGFVCWGFCCCCCWAWGRVVCWFCWFVCFYFTQNPSEARTHALSLSTRSTHVIKK